MESWCLYLSVSFQSFLLTCRLRAGRGSGDAPRIIDVSGGKGGPARQAVQCHYDSHVTDVDYDTR